MPILTSLEQDDTYLDYALSTAPSPVTVSEDPTALSYATLTIVISNPAPDPTVTITVSEITFNVPVGTDGPSLASAGGFGYSVSDTDQKDAWSLAPSGGDGFFTLTPKDPTSPGIVVDAQGIVVTFSKIQVNQVEGTASITIHETATCKVAPPTPQPPQPSGDCTINVPKFPYGFAVSDFALAAPSVPYNGRATLSWTGTLSPDTTYTMYYGAGAKAVNVTGDSPWTSDQLTETTTFILEVVAGKDSDSPKMWFTATQVVETPDVMAHSLEVENLTRLDSDLQVMGATTATGAVEANGGLSATTLQASQLATFQQGATVDGTLTAATIAGGTTIDGNADVQGTLTAPTMAGGMTIDGDVTITGQLHMGPWTFYTDGAGRLLVSNGAQALVLNDGSPISLYVGNQRVFVDGDPAHITNDQGWLNGTTQGSGGDDFGAQTYWRQDPDGDSNLTFGWGNAA